MHLPMKFCMYACMYVCMYVCMHVCVRCKDVRMQVVMQASMNVQIYGGM